MKGFLKLNEVMAEEFKISLKKLFITLYFKKGSTNIFFYGVYIIIQKVKKLI